MRMLAKNIIRAALLSSTLISGAYAEEKTILSPGPTTADLKPSLSQFGNDVARLAWTQTGRHLSQPIFTDVAHHHDVSLLALFSINLTNGEKLTNDDLQLVAAPASELLHADPKASRASDRLEGQAVSARFTDPKGRFTLVWRTEQRSGSPYLRQTVTITPRGQPLALKSVAIFEAHTTRGEVIGDVQGSPVAIDDSYFGIENPLAESLAFNGRSRLTLGSGPIDMGGRI